MTALTEKGNIRPPPADSDWAMPENLPFYPNAVAVVITAKFHNPSILNPDFLKQQRVVPQDWAVRETVTTPPLATVA